MEDHNNLELVLAKAQEEAEQYLNNWKRAKADYANFERQVERSRADWSVFTTVHCLEAILPVYESLIKAADHHEDMVRIRDQMRAALKSLGVEPMETMGKPADPMLHDVIGKEPREGVEPGNIIQEVQQGFLLGSKVLRVAKVIIAE